MNSTQNYFLSKIVPLAQADMKKSGILASLTIAQAIIESGWGNSTLTKKGNALFGIKAGQSWKGKRLSCNTWEVYDGTRVDIVDSFRAYNSWGESVADHSNFLRGVRIGNKLRYQAVIGEKDYKKACRAIQSAGYATAPNYADSLIKVIEDYNLYQYDKVGYCDTIKRAKAKGILSGEQFWQEVLDGKRKPTSQDIKNLIDNAVKAAR